MVQTQTSSVPLVSALADDSDMAPLVSAFVAQLPDKVAEIEQALTADDPRALAQHAEQLKDAASGYGFPVLTALACNIEHAVLGKAGNESVARLVRELVALSTQACAVPASA